MAALKTQNATMSSNAHYIICPHNTTAHQDPYAYYVKYFEELGVQEVETITED